MKLKDATALAPNNKCIPDQGSGAEYNEFQGGHWTGTTVFFVTATLLLQLGSLSGQRLVLAWYYAITTCTRVRWWALEPALLDTL